MHTLTMNMFAETNEDMPIISGAARTEVATLPATNPDHYDVWDTEGKPVIVGMTKQQLGEYLSNISPTLAQSRWIESVQAQHQSIWTKANEWQHTAT